MEQAPDKNPRTVGEMFSTVAPVYDALNRSLSLWQDVLWRKKLVHGADLPPDGIVLDLCTGTGDIALAFLTERKDFNGFVFGLDFSTLMIDHARTKLAKLGAPYPRRVDFLLGDALDLQFMDEKFDVVSVGFGVRNYHNTRAGLAEMYRVLKTGAQANILEFFPDGINSRLVHWYIDTVVPGIGNLISRSSAYSYLCRTSSTFYPVDEFEKLLIEVGFTDIVWESMTLGIAHIVRARKG